MSSGALVALITGSLALLLLIVLSVVSGVRGETPFSFGVIGIIAMIVSLAGLIVSVKSIYERDVYTSVSIAGIAVNGIALVMYVFTYVFGLV